MNEVAGKGEDIALMSSCAFLIGLAANSAQRLHKRTVLGLIEPRLVFGKGSIVLRTGADPELEFAFPPPTSLSQTFTLLAFGVAIVA